MGKLLLGSLTMISLACGPYLYAQAGKVEAIPLSAPASSALSARKPQYTVTVPATGAWVDAGFAVAPGDHLDVTAKGQITLADGRTSDPAGLPKGWKDLLRGFPAEGANAGALAGRIGAAGAAVPFALGASWNEDVTAAGEFFLAANVDGTLAGTGSYSVEIKLGKSQAAATPAAPVNMQQMLPPDLLNGIPRRVEDAAKNPGDVVNFSIIGTKAEVQKAFALAGWVPVDKTDNEAVLHGLLATLSKKAYLSMPMSTLYLFGRPQDLSFARADPLVVALERHHLRVWDAGKQVDGRPFWVGSATHDNGLERDQRNNGVTHHIDPNIDTEREFIEQSFAAAGALAGAAYLTPPDPVHDAKTATGGSFQTDGRVLVMDLRPLK